jgi:hypothetical protein
MLCFYSFSDGNIKNVVKPQQNGDIQIIFVGDLDVIMFVYWH